MSGIFSLSFDVELSWGLVHRNKINLTELTKTSLNVRKVLDHLFFMLENYEVPATWNILGHLILDHCTRKKACGPPHFDMPRPKYAWLGGDWYRYDPCTNILEDPAWYGKDIVDRIVQYVKTSKVNHEIGCHSFSHQQFGDPGCTKELASAEITKCVELMKNEYNIVPQTFAFPRDYVGHLDLLKEHGFTSFRDTPMKLYPCLRLERTPSNYLKTQLSLAVQLMSYYFLVPPHVVVPKEVRQGLWGISGCLAYGRKPLVFGRLITFKAKQGIERAIRESKIFTMYSHLRDFGGDSHFLQEFERVLKFVESKKNQGMLTLKTMSELAGRHVD